MVISEIVLVVGVVILEAMFLSFFIKYSYIDFRTPKGIRNIINKHYLEEKSEQECVSKIMEFYETCKEIRKVKALDKIINSLYEIFVVNLKEKGDSSNLKCKYEYITKVKEIVDETSARKEEKIEINKEDKKESRLQLIGIVLATVIGVVQIILQVN